MYTSRDPREGTIWAPASPMTPAISVSLPETAYLRRLRVLAAWWCLGSSALQPQVLMRHEVHL